MAYLDNAATTPLRAGALAAMLPYLTEHFGNPSGSHAVARRAKHAIEDAREVVAAGLGCRPAEVVFTGGGTEADNMAVLGARGPVVCSAVEHHAVLHATEARGGSIVPVDTDGLVDLDALADHLRGLGASAGLVSVMLANNETGIVQPVAKVVELAHALAPNVLVHTDAVNAFAWVDVADAAAGCDLVSISAHKFGGPKGVGALVVREPATIEPIVHGGGQERERRSGTHDVAAIVGLAAALEETVRDRAVAIAETTRRRDRLVDTILSAVPDAVETGRRETKTAANAHVRFPGVEAEALLVLLDEGGVCASAGSACASGAIEPSHVLLAMGVPREEALGAVRFSLGHATTDGDIDAACKLVPDAVARLRAR